jgi:hypothetical protein
MKTGRISIWIQLWARIRSWWGTSRQQVERENSQQPLRSPVIQEKQTRVSVGVKEYVSHLQAKIGVSPTEGHELVQDLHVTKCRSQGAGAPRSPTAFRRHPIQINLSELRDQGEDQHPTEAIREIGRSAIREIRAAVDGVSSGESQGIGTS